MSREYRHINEYAEEILRLKSEGITKREIGRRVGFSCEQVHNFITRYNRNQRKIAAEIAIKKNGRRPRTMLSAIRADRYIYFYNN